MPSDSKRIRRARHGLHALVERALTWVVSPYLRARILRLLGATIGRNVRIYEARFFNLEHGFRHLVVEDDVYIGPGALLDLTERIEIRRGTIVGSQCVLATHVDAGEQHGSPMTRHFPLQHVPLRIGEYCYIGVNVIILCGSDIGREVAIGAGSVVTEPLPDYAVAAGSPAKILRSFRDSGSGSPGRGDSPSPGPEGGERDRPGEEVS